MNNTTYRMLNEQISEVREMRSSGLTNTIVRNTDQMEALSPIKLGDSVGLLPDKTNQIMKDTSIDFAKLDWLDNSSSGEEEIISIISDFIKSEKPYMIFQMLYNSIMRDDYKICEYIIKNSNIDLNVEFRYGMGSFLHIAIKKNNIKLCKLLIEYGAKINDCKYDDCGNYLIHTAVFYGYKKIYDLLVENGADINKHNKFGNSTPLIHAITSIKNNFTMVSNNLEHIMENEYYEIIMDLINRGVDIHMKNVNGNTPLHLAVVRGNFAVCKILIWNGSDIYETNNYNESALDYAEYNPTLVKFLKSQFEEKEETRYMFKRAHIEYDSDCEIDDIENNYS